MIIWINSAEEFARYAKNDDVLVDITAPAWCAPCQQLMPKFEEASEVLRNVTFLGVDVDANPWVQDTLNVQSVPKILRYRNGRYVGEINGRTAQAIVNEFMEG